MYTGRFLKVYLNTSLYTANSFPETGCRFSQYLTFLIFTANNSSPVSGKESGEWVSDQGVDLIICQHSNKKTNLFNIRTSRGNEIWRWNFP